MVFLVNLGHVWCIVVLLRFIFEHFWSYFGVFGWMFYAFSQLKGEIGGKARLEQRNQAKTQAKPKPTSHLQLHHPARPVSQS